MVMLDPWGTNLASWPSVSTKYRFTASASIAEEMQEASSYMIWPLLVAPIKWLVISSSMDLLSVLTEYLRVQKLVFRDTCSH